MTHWRKQHDPDLTELKRLDARFDLAMRLSAACLLILMPVLWWMALS